MIIKVKAVIVYHIFSREGWKCLFHQCWFKMHSYLRMFLVGILLSWEISTDIVVWAICMTPFSSQSWQVGRAGRFGTKGLAITFVSSAADSDVLNDVRDLFFFILFSLILFHQWFKILVLWIQVQERFEVDIKELPEQIDTSTYSMLSSSFLLVHVIFVSLLSSRERFMPSWNH